MTTRRNAGYRRGLLFVFVLTILVPIGAASPLRSGEFFHDVGALDGARLGILVGTTLDTKADVVLDYIDPVYYDDYHAMQQDLLDGELDAIAGDLPVLRHIAAVDPRFRALEAGVEQEAYGLAVRDGDEEFHDLVNGILRRFHRNGTLSRLEEKWLAGSGTDLAMPPPRRGGFGEPLVLAACLSLPPFAYRDDDGNPAGFDIELGARIARELGRPFAVVTTEFSDLIPALQRGDAALVASCLSVTPEREKLARFTEPYFRCGVGFLVLAEE